MAKIGILFSFQFSTMHPLIISIIFYLKFLKKKYDNDVCAVEMWITKG